MGTAGWRARRNSKLHLKKSLIVVKKISRVKQAQNLREVKEAQTMARLSEEGRTLRTASLEQPHRRDLPSDLRSSEKAATPLGQLNLLGFLTNEQHEAGERFQVIVGEYLSSIASPTAGNRSGGGYDCFPEQCQLNRRYCECRMRKDRFMEACGNLLAIDHKAGVAVSHVAVHAQKCPLGYFRWLRMGLDALVDYFKLNARTDEGKIRRYGEIWRPN